MDLQCSTIVGPKIIICWTITLEVNPGSGMMVLLIIVSVRVHQRPNLAFGISLYVSDDGQPSNVCNTMVRRVP